MNKTTALKMVGKSTRPGLQGRYVLLIAEHNDQLWATNSHWLVPVDWFSVVIPTPSVGTWDAKTGEKISNDAPSREMVAHLWPDDVGLVELEQTRVHGRWAYVQMTDDNDAALFEMPECDKPVAIDRRYLEMLRDKPETGELVLLARDNLKPIVAWRAQALQPCHRRAQGVLRYPRAGHADPALALPMARRS